MKKYIRICACCGNTFETDKPAFTIAENGRLYKTNLYTSCKACKDKDANLKGQMITMFTKRIYYKTQSAGLERKYCNP